MVIFTIHNYKVAHIAQMGDCWIINLIVGSYVFNSYCEPK